MIKYYLPIDSMCLAHYYSYACIAPSCYYNNRPKDIQDKFNQYLLLTSKFGTNETDCCLELIFTSEEKDSLVPLNNGWYIFKMPIPISRVRKIIFTSQEQMNTTLTNIRMSTAFVPAHLGEVVGKFENNSSSELKLPEQIVAISHSEKLQKFNCVLGALALMNVSRERYMNYSDKFFETFSFFNSYIAKQLAKVKKVIGQSLAVYLDESEKFSKYIQILKDELSEDVLMERAKSEDQVIIKNKITRVIDLSSLKGWTYIFAFIYQYGVGAESKRKKIDSLIINNFKSDDLLEKPSVDTLALLYGYNRGYNVFNNAYGLDSNNMIDVKFRMESLLDHYIVESIYQYIFHNRIVDSAFDYIDEWCPKKHQNQSIKSTDYQILDVIVIGKKKAVLFSQEYWIGLFQEFTKDGFWDALQKLCGVVQFEKQIKSLVNRIYDDIKEEFESKTEEKLSQYEAEIKSRDEKIVSLNENLKKLKLSERGGNLEEKELPISPGAIKTSYDKNKMGDLFMSLESEGYRNNFDIDTVLDLYEQYSHMTIVELQKELSIRSVKFDRKEKKENLKRLLIKNLILK